VVGCTRTKKEINGGRRYRLSAASAHLNERGRPYNFSRAAVGQARRQSPCAARGSQYEAAHYGTKIGPVLDPLAIWPDDTVGLDAGPPAQESITVVAVDIDERPLLCPTSAGNTQHRASTT
jgi:hypothetical protein